MYVIAELGSNWQDLNDVLTAVKEVSEAGAQALKIQYFRADTLYSRERALNLYLSARRYEFPAEWLPIVASQCEKLGLDFGASVFSPSDVATLIPYVKFFKVASGDMVNRELIDKVYATEKQVFISTGAATNDEILDVSKTYPEAVMMACVSKYPAKTIDYRLGLGDLVEGVIGLSDHTINGMSKYGYFIDEHYDLACYAAAYGYTYFEKHFRPSSLKNETPDYGHSVDKIELHNYIFYLNRVKGIFENRELTPEEERERLWARRGKDGLRPVDEVYE